ncbi:hypothetical protein BDZ91DRAFT_129168 [Kalaharituber pfeilii]|nr:hypothetical protein BDZ91DRAFT_129168 [Kalaharituber pfeilii]
MRKKRPKPDYSRRVRGTATSIVKLIGWGYKSNFEKSRSVRRMSFASSLFFLSVLLFACQVFYVKFSCNMYSNNDDYSGVPSITLSRNLLS